MFRRDILFSGNNINTVSNTHELVYVKQTNAFPDSIAYFYNNEITNYGSYYYATGIRVIRTVPLSFETSNPSSWTTYPWQRTMFSKNTLTRILSSINTKEQISFSWVDSSGDDYMINLTSEEIATMTLPAQTNFDFTYSHTSLTSKCILNTIIYLICFI